MSGTLSTHAAVLAQQFIAGLAPTPPAALYAALGTSSNGAFLELTASDYARQPFTPSVSTAGAMSNAAGITFGPNNAIAWGAITWCALYDAVTGGNLLWSGPLTAGPTVSVGDSVTILAGAFTTALAAA
jgi:hypothetical protein